MSRAVFILLALAACDASESTRVSATVETSAAGVAPCTSDLGYEVTLTVARVALRDLELTAPGEQHSLLRRLILPVAHAHPGHASGGKITGELPGTFAIDLAQPRAALGTATMLTGSYEGANFTFRRAAELPAADPLSGHTFHLEGTAARDGRTITFSAIVDIDEGARMIGAPFQLVVAGTGAPALGLALLPQDPTEAETVFDGIDFFILDGDGDDVVEIAPGAEAHNLLRRNLQVHDHYEVKAQ